MTSRTKLAVIATLLGLSLLAVNYGVNNLSMAPPTEPEWEIIPRKEVAAGSVTVRFTGSTTLLFDDGETSWMTDGWFSRPTFSEIITQRVEPDLSAISRGLKANEVDKLDAVIPLHSHYDHAMDSPEVARRTGAKLYGSESTANIARGWGLDEGRIEIFTNKKSIVLGDFIITPIESNHFQFVDPEIAKRALDLPTIDSPLVPPAPITNYRVGKTYVLHVEHPLGSFAIVGSAGFIEGGLRGFKADVLFLGVGSLGKQSVEYRQKYWEETVGRLEPSTVIPIHYDSLLGEPRGPVRGHSALYGVMSGTDNLNVLPYLEENMSRSESVTSIATLPRFTEVEVPLAMTRR
jgi:L-ascorbate metabolism protein UlaG (beta-lactamase superfamily)